MATRKKAKKKVTKKVTKKATKKKAAKKKSARKAPKRAASRSKAKPKRPARRPAARRAPKAAAPPPRNGVITHTELASSDPLATRAWATSVFGWEFAEPMPSAQGPYHMWRFSIGTGGGLRSTGPSETTGSTPYVEVASMRAAYNECLAAGASEMMPPMEIPGGMGWIAIVSAPGDVAIGLWSAKP